MFGIFKLANIVYVRYFVKETNGKSLEEMKVVFGTVDSLPAGMSRVRIETLLRGLTMAVIRDDILKRKTTFIVFGTSYFFSLSLSASPPLSG